MVVNALHMSAAQYTHLRRALSLPVIDRYLLILHIFKAYARSDEAKLHARLAELPYLR